MRNKITCIRCGEVFIATRSDALRCPPCRKALNVERTRARRKVLREMAPPKKPQPRKRPDLDQYLHFGDSLEKIEKCLECKRVTCYGTCDEMTRRAKK